MSTRPLTPKTLAVDMPAASAVRTPLLKLYLVRGLLAVAWAALFLHVRDALGVRAAGSLVAYPLIDAVSSLVDYRGMSSGLERQITSFNGILSTLAAIGVGAAANSGPAAVLTVFGLWAAISGAAQFALGLLRPGSELGRQWPMLIAGGLSCLVGIAYCIQATGPAPSLAVLSAYATGGGLFFIVQAGLLAWRSHQRRQVD